MSFLIHHFLEESSERYPQKIALFHGEIKATFQEINSLANRLAYFLLSKGLQKGDRVVMAMENSLEAVVSYYGILKAGGVTVEVSEKSTKAEVSYFIENSEAGIGILSKASARRLDGLMVPVIIGPDHVFSNPLGEYVPWKCIGEYVPWKDIWGEYVPWKSTNDDIPHNPGIHIKEDDLASIIYTSGSTGRPKGVMLTHGNICSNTAPIVSYLGIRESDRVMAILPFYYVYGKTLLNTHFSMGGSIVINNQVAFPTAVVQDMAEKEITGFAGVPSTFAMLMNRSTFPSTKIPSLRYVTQAGGAMAPALTRRVMESIGSASLYIMYGATEASARLTYLPPHRLTDKLGSLSIPIGIPIPNVHITIRDDQGRELPPGEEGNICGQGPNIMKGYWKDREETQTALKPWGLITGDIGHRDEEGFIYVTGRKKEMLKVGGERIAPREIEDVIIESQMVHEVAVIGRADGVLSEVPEVFVVPMDNKSFKLELLMQFIMARLSLPKHPRHWNIVKSLPKKPSGKIDKEALKQL